MRPRVFLIDDHRSFVTAFFQQFKMDWDISTETSGVRALARLQEDEEYDLILLDLYIPDLTGAEIYESMARLCPARLRRTVFISAGADNPTLVPWLAATKLPVIMKPVVDLDVIRNHVAHFASLDITRGPKDMAPKFKPSKPELDPIFENDDEEVSTDVIDLAIQRGVPKDVVLELRIRRLHSSHKELKVAQAQMQGDLETVKQDVASMKTDVTDLKKQSIEANASLKTTIKLTSAFVAALVILTGALWELYKTFELHK